MSQHQSGWVKNSERRNSILGLLPTKGASLEVSFRVSESAPVKLGNIALSRSSFSRHSMEEEALIDTFLPILNSAGIKNVTTVSALSRRLACPGIDERYALVEPFLSGLSGRRKTEFEAFLKTMKETAGDAWRQVRAKIIIKYSARQVPHIVLGSGMASDHYWLARIPALEEDDLKIYLPTAILRGTHGQDELSITGKELARFNKRPDSFLAIRALRTRCRREKPA